MKKRGQVTLFIIIAVIIAAAVILFVVLYKFKGIDIFLKKPSMQVPSEYIEQCAIDAVRDSIDIMLPQGGYIQPKNYRMHEGNKVAYLCYEHNYYYPCINQEPMYLEHMEKEIKTNSEDRILDCFENMKTDYIDGGYSVNMDDEMILEIIIKPKKVEIIIKRKFEAKKEEETRRFEKVETSLNSPLGYLGDVAREIVNQESDYCDFDTTGYSLLYPSVEVSRVYMSEGVKVYTLKDKFTDKKLKIAIRSCVLPAGR